MAIDSNGDGGMTKNLFSGNVTCAPISGFQFTSAPLNGVYQFGSSTSNGI
jgi:hypothetical protein